jgi:hypothetical protein
MKSMVEKKGEYGNTDKNVPVLHARGRKPRKMKRVASLIL